MMNPIDYYNQYADAFVERTVNADMQGVYQKFTPLLPAQAKILDAGCGSGRDSLYFKNAGFDVVSFDASIEMVKVSTALVGQPTLQLNFQDIKFRDEFDAVWASASLLHTPYEELPQVLQKLHLALKPQGIFYASFKYGTGRREADERVFYDMDEKTIVPYLNNLFTPLETWSRPDTRQRGGASPSRAWLCFLAKRE